MRNCGLRRLSPLPFGRPVGREVELKLKMEVAELTNIQEPCMRKEAGQLLEAFGRKKRPLTLHSRSDN